MGSVWVSLDGGICRDAQGSPVEEGTSVIVFDLNGRELAASRLADKRESDGACIFGFRLSGIPSTENIYDLLINEQFWSLNREDLDAGEWEVDLINPELSRRWTESQDANEASG